MLISIKLTIPFFSLIIFFPSILTIKAPNNELIELVHEFKGLPKEEVQKLYNNCVYLNDMFAHIDRNPKKLDYKYHHDLIARVLIAKGAKPEEIEYKLNKMNDEKAYKILSDYTNQCEQKIKDIEKEVKVKALMELGRMGLEKAVPYSSLQTNETKCAICKKEFKDEEFVLELICEHILHDDCMIKRSNENNQNIYYCPTCGILLNLPIAVIKKNL
uniref:RING-type domain-containing protein n=1 Tax=Meloidogyne enterolobii TaxID=390850 RepID=A0A6V7VX09_MELEN|nr:unnamed protein product [Meloidogyne enterolobii]